VSPLCVPPYLCHSVYHSLPPYLTHAGACVCLRVSLSHTHTPALPPHIFFVARKAYHTARRDHLSTSIIFTGAAGAGGWVGEGV
jgi:hypothetical protein